MALLLSGCFQYVPATIDTLPAGGEVRVYLSRIGMAQVPEEIPTGGAYVNGRLVREGPDSLLLQVPISRRVEDLGVPDLRQNVLIPNREILEVRLREFSRTRTAFAVGGTAGLGSAIVLLVLEAVGSSEGDPGETEDQIRIPLLSVRFP